jgi:hypothetical protein
MNRLRRNRPALVVSSQLIYHLRRAEPQSVHHAGLHESHAAPDRVQCVLIDVIDGISIGGRAEMRKVIAARHEELAVSLCEPGGRLRNA